MARISDMDGNENTEYSRLFGDKKRGYLISQIHAAKIRSGTELEKILLGLIPDSKINTIRNIAQGNFSNSQKEVVIKPTKPKSGEEKSIVSDFGVFYHLEERFLIIELKDGGQFDTQKSPATKTDLQKVVDYIHNRTGYAGSFYVCSFNLDSKKEIITGFKMAFTESQVMTGPELCYHLDVDLEDVIEARKEDQRFNREYFDEMAGLIRGGIDEEGYFDRAEEYKTGQMKLIWGDKK